jgi:hypothetical protein
MLCSLLNNPSKPVLSVAAWRRFARSRLADPHRSGRDSEALLMFTSVRMLENA